MNRDKARIEELEKFIVIVRDTLSAKANADRTSFTLWKEANQLMLIQEDTP